ncbi:hypothetical protein Tco_1090817 [Tanacetum coccineum]|uniref:Uncharacterized protein n=1 Tax=Tanacetum coccineum TaxID=301880 RepID=A0ABQ5I6F1_9ASTR
MQTQESKIDTGKALDANLVDTESIRTDSTVQDDSSRSGNDTDADDANIRPIYDEEPMTEYPETCQVKSPMLDSSPDNQTTEYSKQSLESENILLKETVAQFQKDFSRMEAHCIALELKYQNQSLKSGQHAHLGIVLRTCQDLIQMTVPYSTYLDEARKKTQERDRNSKTSVMLSARFQSTADGSKPKPRSNNQTSRSLPEVNSRAKIQSHKTRNSNKPVDQKSHTQKPGRQIFTGHRFSPNKTSAVYEKTSPRSDLRWKPTNIPNIHECKQTLDVSAGTSINVQKEQSLDLSVEVHQAAETVTTSNELDLLFGLFFDQYFNRENQVVLKSSAVTTTDASNKRQQQPDSTSSTSTLATTVTANGNFDL